jgi:putative transposase
MSISQGDGQIKCTRFSDEQIIGILKEQEAGVVTADVCRRRGISEATFYKWKAKFGGLEVSEAKRLRTLEEENAKLKNLLAARAVSLARRRLLASRNSFDQA